MWRAADMGGKPFLNRRADPRRAARATLLKQSRACAQERRRRAAQT
jgi:hypothetical protein